MEEKKKRNVEDVVSKFRHPAVITGRKTSKANKPFESLPISVFHCNNSKFQSEHKLPNTSAKPSSLLSIIDKCDVDEKGEQVIYKNFNFDEVKDSSTQTSKTIIQLAKLETGEMSPDSLSPSPRNVQQDFCNFENFTLDGSTTDCTPYNFNRRMNTIEYYQSIEDRNQIDNKNIPSQNTSPVCEYPRRSLIETYLEKSKNRINAPINRSKSGEKFRYLPPPNAVLEEESMQQSFRSQSLVDSYQNYQNFIALAPDAEKVQPQFTRFTVRNIRERNHVNVTYRDTIYERGAGCQHQQTKRSNSFMLPTISSEQKSKMDEIRQIKQLISPTRRGRSGSPVQHIAVSNKVEVFRKDTSDKIPYIDGSKLKIPSGKCIMPKERKSLLDRTKSPNTISPILPPNDFQRDMSRIDQMSLTLMPSDDSISERTRATDAMSLCSVENSVSEVMCRIQDSDWNVSLKALADATELCRTIEMEIMMPHMMSINQKLIELLRSPRSHVCRTSCQAAGHLFESMKDTRGPEFNDIVDILLGKTADANKFIRQDANLALDCMVTHIPTFHAIRALCSKGPLHKNHLVRCATVRLIICAVVIAGPDVILNPCWNEHTRRRIFTNMIRFLEDKNLETRKYGERLYKVLSKEPNFDQFLRKYIDRDDLMRMKKTLKFLSKRV